MARVRSLEREATGSGRALALASRLPGKQLKQAKWWTSCFTCAVGLEPLVFSLLCMLEYVCVWLCGVGRLEAGAVVCAWALLCSLCCCLLDLLALVFLLQSAGLNLLEYAWIFERTITYMLEFAAAEICKWMGCFLVSENSVPSVRTETEPNYPKPKFLGSASSK